MPVRPVGWCVYNSGKKSVCIGSTTCVRNCSMSLKKPSIVPSARACAKRRLPVRFMLHANRCTQYAVQHTIIG